jgi:hypothetical protein
MADHIYAADGTPRGFRLSNYIYDSEGNPVGRVFAEKAYRFDGSYVGALINGMIVDKPLVSRRSIAPMAPPPRCRGKSPRRGARSGRITATASTC